MENVYEGDREERLNFLFSNIGHLEKQEGNRFTAAMLAQYCFGVCAVMNDVQLEERKDGTFVQGQSKSQKLAIHYYQKSNYYSELSRQYVSI